MRGIFLAVLIWMFTVGGLVFSQEIQQPTHQDIKYRLDISGDQALTDPTVDTPGKLHHGFAPSGIDWKNQGAIPLAPIVIPAAVTTPVHDGTISPGEYADAVALNPVTVVTPGNNAWLKNDACYLYIGAIVRGPSYYAGNATMINVWFDLDRDGLWDITGDLDGNLGLPGPGYRYPSNVAAFGYIGLAGWPTSQTGRLRYHRPWWALGTIIPKSQVDVIRVQKSITETHIEAKIDIRNNPLMRMVGGVPINMRVQWYQGYYNIGGTVQIQAQWPTRIAAAYFSGPTPAELRDIQTTYVPSLGNVLQIVDIDAADYVVTKNNPISIDVEAKSTPPPQTTNYEISLRGPLPSTTTMNYNGLVTFTSSLQTKSILLPTASLAPGYYKITATVYYPGECGIDEVVQDIVVMVIAPGTKPCVVWPGDLDNNTVSNLGDRRVLQKYIFDANLNPLALHGPRRFRIGKKNEMTTQFEIFDWVGQPAFPWPLNYIPNGCYVDANGDGITNNFDLMAIKFNIGKTHPVSPKPGRGSFFPAVYKLRPNYPNPFHSATAITYEIPENSYVRFTVVDRLGREVRSLVDKRNDAGIYRINFIATDLPRGMYYGILRARSLSSDKEFTQSIKMLLTK